MKTFVFTFALLLSTGAMAQYSDATRAALDSTLPGGENDPNNPNTGYTSSLPQQSDVGDLPKYAQCAKEMNEVLATAVAPKKELIRAEIRTDYKGNGTDHFIFKTPNPRSVIYLGEKGLFDCNLAFPDNKEMRKKDLRIDIDAHIALPYGPTSSAAVEAKKCTPLSSSSEEASKMKNRFVDNLVYFGAGMRAKKFSRSQALNNVPKSCAFIESYKNHVENGFTASADNMNKTVFVF